MLNQQKQLSLEAERLRIEKQLYAAYLDQYIPMPLAAATTFHQAHGKSDAVVSREEYDEALGVAASALSRLVPVYTLDRSQERVEVKVDLLRFRFALGAAQLRRRDSSEVIEPLWVPRSGMLSAISLIKRTGLRYSFATVPGAAKQPTKGAESERGS